jgi:hypothetical protein
MSEGRGHNHKERRCTCWVLVREDTVHADGWESAEYEQVPDPKCPVHGKKIYPILEDDDWGYPSAPS